MRAARTAVALLTVLVSTAGCGLGTALGAGPAAAPVSVPGPSTPTSSPAPPVPSTVPLAVVPGPGADDLLTVTRGEVQVGFAPPLTDWPQPCGVDDAALEYVPLTITFSGAELAGRLTVTTTAATPADVDPIGVFVDDATDPYCQGDPAFPSSDTPARLG